MILDYEAFIEENQTKEIIDEYAISGDDLTELFKELQRIDKEEFGINTAVNAAARVYGKEPCDKAVHSISARVNGDIFACISADGEERALGNIRKGSGSIEDNLKYIVSIDNPKYIENAHCISCSAKAKKSKLIQIGNLQKIEK